MVLTTEGMLGRGKQEGGREGGKRKRRGREEEGKNWRTTSDEVGSEKLCRVTS